MKKYILLLTLTFTLFIIAGCNNTDEDDAKQNSEESTQSQEDDDQKDDEDNENSKNEEDDSNNDVSESDVDKKQNDDEEEPNSSENDDSDNDLPDTIEINEEKKHPDGVNLELETISFEEDHISVTFNAQNTSEETVQLAKAGGVELMDNEYNKYRYVADSDSAEIELKELEKVTGTINFVGKIADDAKSLTLKFNPDALYEGGGFTHEPEFTFKDIEIKR